MALSTTAATGTQSTTQSPQTSTSATGAASTQSGQIQPGTTDSLLKSQNGIALNPTPVTTVSLGKGGGFSEAKAYQPHHANAFLLLFSVALFVAAVVLFWTTGRSVNKTTK